MRLLLLSDLHGQHSTLYQLEDALAAADLIVVCGDFTEFGGKADMESMLEPFSAYFGKMGAVGGNCDRHAARLALEAAGVSVDGRHRRIVGPEGVVSLVGAGGGILRNGLTPFERRDAELHEAFEAAIRSLDEAGEGRPNLIAATHTPPHDTDADLRNGAHVGSRALRHMLDALSPLVWACGHIHESRSVSRVGSSLLVNPGPLREGYYAEAQVELPPGRSRAEAELRRL